MKKLGEFIKSHKLLAIILAAVIFLSALWTPVIIILTKQSNQKENASSVVASGVSGVFVGDYSVISSETSSVADKDEASSAQSSSENMAVSSAETISQENAGDTIAQSSQSSAEVVNSDASSLVSSSEVSGVSSNKVESTVVQSSSVAQNNVSSNVSMATSQAIASNSSVQSSSKVETNNKKPNKVNSSSASQIASSSQASTTTTPSNSVQSSSTTTSTTTSTQSSSSSKVESAQTSSNKTSSVDKISRPQFTGGDYIPTEEETIDENAPKIICWGDSITQGMGVSRDASYPGVLQSLIGKDYRVLNAGSGGEKSQTIAARQGAYEVYLKADIVFEEGYGSVRLDETNGFVLEDGTLLDINEDGESFRNDVPCKKIYINGKEYELYANGESIEILREEYNKKLVLKKGSKVVFESANTQKGSYCEIFYVSANDAGYREGEPEDVEYLINRYKAMIKRHGDDKYMVIIPQWAGGYTEALKAEFGERAVDLKAEICNRVINRINYPSSEEDIKEAKRNVIPTSLKYENNPSDTLHFNEEGYKMMGQIIYENGVKLKFWK